MICKPCGNGVHSHCDAKTRGKTWCDCQHKVEGKWIRDKLGEKDATKDA